MHDRTNVRDHSSRPPAPAPDFAYDDSLERAADVSEAYQTEGTRNLAGHVRLDDIAPLTELLPGFRTPRPIVELRPASLRQDIERARAKSGVMVVDNRRLGYDSNELFGAALNHADVVVVDAAERRANGLSKSTQAHRRGLRRALAPKYSAPLFVRSRGRSERFVFEAVGRDLDVFWLVWFGSAIHLREVR